MPTVRTLALLGNTVALVLLTLLCGAGDTLYSDADLAPDVAPASPLVAAASEPGHALLVVVDGLRLDIASDAETMPALAALAARGARTELAVEALVPSTIAALQAMIEGRRVAPSAALHDFGASAAPGGGTLERLQGAGGTAVVAATHLWQGLYGRFIDGGLPVPGLPNAASDARVARAAGLILERTGASRPNLVVAHFGALDAVGHRHGGASDDYRRTATRIDAAAAPLVARALADGRTVVYTSDHGTTDAGGHAGGESVVRRVPLVVAGHGLPQMLRAQAPVYQRDLPALLDAALGLEESLPSTAGTSANAYRSGHVASRLGATALATLAGLAIVARRRRLTIDARASTLLSGGVWIVLGTVFAAGPVVAAVVGTCLLAIVALGSPRCATRSDTESSTVGLAFGAGTGLAALAVLDARLGAGAAGAGVAAALAVLLTAACALGGARRSPGSPGSPGSGGKRGAGSGSVVALAGAALAFGAAGHALAGAPLAALAVAASVAGALTARSRSALLCGIALAALPVALARLAGDTASLSSIDVSLAHRMAESALGLTAAVATAIARLALLPVAVVAGHVLARALHCAPGSSDGESDTAENAGTSTFAALAAVQLGAGFACALALALGAAPPGAVADATAGIPLAAGGLGGLLRELNLAIWLWLTAAAGIGLHASRRIRRRRHGAGSARAMPQRSAAARPSGTRTTIHADHMSDTNAR